MRYLVVILIFMSVGTILAKTYTLIPNRMNEFNGDTLIMQGQLIEVPFVNKAGRKMGFSELYLKSGKERYFLKLRDGEVKRTELEKFLNKEIQLKVILREGNWDSSAGDPEMQSRIGKYLVVLEILK